jgi:hypothetical protein
MGGRELDNGRDQLEVNKRTKIAKQCTVTELQQPKVSPREQGQRVVLKLKVRALRKGEKG